MDMQWTLYDSSGAPLVSQVAAPSTTTDPVQNGYGSGPLSGYNIATDGTIMGSFSNGRTAALGQIALATFSNPQGLERQGDNEFSATWPQAPLLPARLAQEAAARSQVKPWSFPTWISPPNFRR